MKFKVRDDYSVVFEEVYGGFTLRTSEGNEIHICMRDDTFEFNIMPKGATEYNWKRINMQTGEVESFYREQIGEKEIGVTNELS